jgi:hypothetical protein
MMTSEPSFGYEEVNSNNENQFQDGGEQGAMAGVRHAGLLRLRGRRYDRV